MSFRPLLVLFLSTGNAARSLLAEAIMNAKGSDRFTARSAGCNPLQEIPQETLALLESGGVFTPNLHPKNWSEFQTFASLKKIDVVVTLSEEARLNCPSWLNEAVKVHWAVDDPLGAAREDVREWKFKKCFATLEARIRTLVRGKETQTPSELYMQLMDVGMVV